MSVIEELRQGYAFGQKKWTDEEWRTVQELLSQGKSRADIGLAIGRSAKQVNGKIKWHSMTEEQLERRRYRIRLSHKKMRGEPVRPPVTPVTRREPPDEAIAERQQREAAPKTLTGWFCGDPPIGFSALERKDPVYVDNRAAQLKRRPSLAGESA